MRSRLLLASFLTLILLGGCAETPRHAPVSDRATSSRGAKARDSDWRPQTHKVQKGDTLYSIALEYGFDYKELAELNGISAPYRIRIGQSVRLPVAKAEETATAQPLKSAPPVAESKAVVEVPSGSLLKTGPKPGKVPYSVAAETAPPVVVAKADVGAAKIPPPVEAPKAVENKPVTVHNEEKKPPQVSDDEDDTGWSWPTKGKVIATFNEGANIKGVDISGKSGQPVLAAAAGKVVYSGNGLRGYGKLVIIKHNKTYLSAYAHNSQILVKEGQNVSKGQRIAEMGNSDADQVKLHFEIRRLGKPVDPLKLLPGNSG